MSSQAHSSNIRRKLLQSGSEEKFMNPLDHTHDRARRSWVASANADDTDFPLQNLPLGVFRRANEAPRIGVAIGTEIVDLNQAFDLDLLPNLAELETACRACDLNELMSRGRDASRVLRSAMFDLLAEGAALQSKTASTLVPAAEVQMVLPARIGDFTDFYTSIHHATRGGRISRPTLPPLFPNFRSLPIAYHGRSSSVAISGTPCVRPYGQVPLSDGQNVAPFLPTSKLDFELEVGLFVGSGNPLGHRVSLDDADSHIFGLCLVNDWSARDIQRWESQPLGPFQAKNFLTSVSPWVITLDALTPFRKPAADRGIDAPPVVTRLSSPRHSQVGAVAINLEVQISSAQMRSNSLPAITIAKTDFAQQYWTLFQMLTHHTSNGCNLRSGDLLASGTVSGVEDSEAGCMFEITHDGKKAIRLPSGETRTYLEDGDEVHLTGRCSRDGFRSIGFGSCVGRIHKALD